MTLIQGDHPLLVELADFMDGNLEEIDRFRISQHLDGCRTCRLLLRGGTTPISVPAASVPVDSAHLERRLLDRLSSDSPDPQPGQLWRLRWAETTTLAVVLRLEEDDVIVAPVGLDEWMADDYAVVVSADWSPIETGLAIWVSLESVVPLVVLDVFLGDVDALDQIAEVRHAYRKGIAVPDTILVGTRVDHGTDERRQYRRHLSLAFSSLSEADWLGRVATSEPDQALADLLRGIDPRQLSTAVGLDAPNTFDLVRGERLISRDEAQRIGDLIDIDPEVVLAARPAVASGLLRELNHPHHRRTIEQRARQAGHSDLEERLIALRGLLPVAARRAGDIEAPLDWRRLVRDWLNG